jgi:acetylornithine deacetylase/succinyl-diaminopimelate desuccinylase-like protein
MRISSQKILGGLVLITAVVLAVFRTLPPRALSTNAPANEFSAERAIGTIKAITNSPRLVGSPAYENAKEYLIAQLATLGLETDVQSTTMDRVRVENILGRFEGSQSTDAILLTAHLDSVSNSPGVTDDGSGIAVILETIRALRVGTPLRNTIIILFTGPEEDCHYGAEAFVSQHPRAKDVCLVVNVDAGGLSGPSILAATGPNAGWLIE